MAILGEELGNCGKMITVLLSHVDWDAIEPKATE